MAPRFRVRTLLILVALVAIGFGASIEFRNRQRRDYIARWEVRFLRQAAWHLEEAVRCDEARRQALPYKPEERLEFNIRYASPLWIATDTTKLIDWQTEASYHLERGRLGVDQAKAIASEKQMIQRRLLSP